jgi:hypothetical protein
MKDERKHLNNEVETKLVRYYRKYYGEVPDPLKNWDKIVAQLTLDERTQLNKKREILTYFLSWVRQKFFTQHSPNGQATKRNLPFLQSVTIGVILVIFIVASSLIITALVNNSNQPLPGTSENKLSICSGLTSLDCAFKQNPGLNQVLENKLGQEVNLSKTVNSFTVTIKYLYADTNRVVIAYVINGSPKLNYNPAALATLTDDNGIALPLIGGEYGGVVNGTTAEIKWYNTSSLNPNSTELKLRFQVLSIVINSLLSTETESGQSVIRQTNAEISQGPFTFDLSVPFEAGKRQVEPDQKVTVNGISVTLERVLISPSETRVYLRGIQPPADQVTVLLNNNTLKATKCWSIPTDQLLTMCSFDTKYTSETIEGQLSIEDQWVFPFFISKT